MNESATPTTAAPTPAPVVSAPAGGRPHASDGPRGRRGRATSAPVLGVHVTGPAITAVLMRTAGDGFEPIRQFTRQRTGALSGTHEMAGFEAATPETIATGDDVMIRFGAGAPSGGDLFMESEFAGLAGSGDGAFDLGAGGGAAGQAASPIVFELKDIVEECSAAGFERPALAFCVGSPDVDYVELVVTPEPEKKGKKGAKPDDARAKKAASKADPKADAAPVKRERLLALLPKSDTPYDRERVAFIPMTPRENLRRYLAILPRPEEPVAASLELLREQQGMKRVPFRTLDAEVPVLVGLARYAFPTAAHENTAIVRVGVEDTLVILLAGSQLHHCDHMRSVTTFDGPDTICSRVLLQQDVQGIGTVHNVIVVSEEREDELVAGFSAFYPEARVEALRYGMARAGIAGPLGPLPTGSLVAAGVAAHALIRKDSVFDDVNLLPKQLRRRRQKVEVGVAWHTLLVGVLLFLSVLFFMGLYFAQGKQIAAAEQRLAEYPPQASMTPEQLQARIDSLNGVHAQITTSLAVLDSLLIGSDQWVQTLSRTSRAAAQTGGLWVEEWQPADGNQLMLHGFSTGRDQVVRLAERLTASIEELSFKEIRTFPVYEYRMRLTIPQELPQVARYLREQADPGAPVVDEPLADQVPLPAAP